MGLVSKIIENLVQTKQQGRAALEIAILKHLYHTPKIANRIYMFAGRRICDLRAEKGRLHFVDRIR
jgi:hypothetical protein